VAERDDLRAVLQRTEKKCPSIAKLYEDYESPARLVMVLTDEMTDEEKEMRCYAYYLQKGFDPAQAEQKAQELLLMLESIGETFQ